MDELVLKLTKPIPKSRNVGVSSSKTTPVEQTSFSKSGISLKYTFGDLDKKMKLLQSPQLQKKLLAQKILETEIKKAKQKIIYYKYEFGQDGVFHISPEQSPFRTDQDDERLPHRKKKKDENIAKSPMFKTVSREKLERISKRNTNPVVGQYCPQIGAIKQSSPQIYISKVPRFRENGRATSESHQDQSFERRVETSPRKFKKIPKVFQRLTESNYMTKMMIPQQYVTIGQRKSSQRVENESESLQYNIPTTFQKNKKSYNHHAVELQKENLEKKLAEYDSDLDSTPEKEKIEFELRKMRRQQMREREKSRLRKEKIQNLFTQLKQENPAKLQNISFEKQTMRPELWQTKFNTNMSIDSGDFSSRNTISRAVSHKSPILVDYKKQIPRKEEAPDRFLQDYNPKYESILPKTKTTVISLKSSPKKMPRLYSLYRSKQIAYENAQKANS